MTHKNINDCQQQLPAHLNHQAEPFHPSPGLRGQTQHKQNTDNAPGSSRYILPKGLKCYYCWKRGHAMRDCKGANQGLNKSTMMAMKAHASIVQETACCNLVCSATGIQTISLLQVRTYVCL